MVGPKHIGIIGGGKMGIDLFHFVSGFPFAISMICRSEEKAEKIKSIWLRKQKRALKHGLMDQKVFDWSVDNQLIGTDLTALGSCDLVIETVDENLNIKRDVFEKLDKILDADCVICSNTSSIPLELIMPTAITKRSLIGLHFFHPLAFKKMLEVNIPMAVKEGNIKMLADFIGTIQKQAVILNSPHHFLINRLFLSLQAGCAHLHISENVGISQIDAWVKETIFPPGVFEFMDTVGIDVMCQSVQSYAIQMKRPADYQDLLALLENLLAQGKLGKKSGYGFYTYDKDATGVTNIGSVKTIADHQINKLLVSYFNPLFEVVEKGILDAETVHAIVADYGMSDQSPFELAKRLGYSYDPVEDVF